MKTTIAIIKVHMPPANGVKAHDREVRIVTGGGDLMMNRLRRYLQMESNTRLAPEDERVVVEAPNDLLLQITDAYVKKSKAMRRMDYALDRKTEENEDWRTFAQWLYESLYNLSDSAEAFIHAILDAKGGGDELLSQITQPLEELQSRLSAAGDIIHEVEREPKDCGDKCDCIASEWGPAPSEPR